MAAGAEEREDPRIRTLRKKLAQIVSLESKLQSNEGYEINSEQHAKLGQKAEVEAELSRLLGRPQPESSSAPPAPPPGTDGRSGRAVTCEGPISAEARSPGKMPGNGGKENREHSQDANIPTVAAQKGQAAAADDPPGDGHGPSPRCRSSSVRWEDDPVAVEDIALTPNEAPEVGAEILENVQPFSAKTGACARLRKLVRMTSQLSTEVFETDVLAGVTRRKKWRLTLLARAEGSARDWEGDPWGGLLGFLAYKLKPLVHSVSIAKLAVVPEHRGKGHGRKLVQWCIAMARKQPGIMYLSLTSLPKAVRFYKQIGFRQLDVDLSKIDCESDDDDEYDYVEGQVYMEYRCRGRGPAGNKRA